MTVVYPADTAERDRFVFDRRRVRESRDPYQHQGCLVEDEPDPRGVPAGVATIFLTGRECPWRCAMCDLWRYTTVDDTPAGAIARQIDAAVGDLRRRAVFPPQIKLYNAGSFFDPRAVPPGDYGAIATALAPFSHVIVESHPALVGPRVDRLQAALTGRTLEVAMGLETAHPSALEQLNKRMTLDDFSRAADALRTRGIALRVFLLVNPPFVPADAQHEWLQRSVDTAFDCGAGAVSLIPTRPGNGTIEALAAAGAFVEPRLTDLERAFAAALARSRGRVFADLWDVGRFTDCPSCADARAHRLRSMNLTQRLAPPVGCDHCGGSAAA